jgi:tRNA dimethylallyltransferase
LQFAPYLLQRWWFRAGPTATGKTAAALCLARRINAEIVSLDSMSLYREMDIGTAKPTREQRALIPHHLIDILQPHEEYSVAEYLHATEAACREIVGRGRIPLFVGGTGLYLRAVLRGVFEGPAADRDVRRALEQELEREGSPALHRRLQRVDPVTAARVPPADSRRIIRALEVHQLTGSPISELQRHAPLPSDLRPRHVYWLHPPRAWLHERINGRVLQMVRGGLVDEVRKLLAAPQPLSRTARQAVGYAQMIEHLAGRRSLEHAIAEMQTATRQFAKRQHTWFRNLVECRAIELAGDESPEAIAHRIELAARADQCATRH